MLTDHHADACKSRESNTYWCELRNSQKIRFVSSNTVFELESSTHRGGQRGRGGDGEAKSACARHLRWERAEAASRQNASRPIPQSVNTISRVRYVSTVRTVQFECIKLMFECNQQPLTVPVIWTLF
jgi:hypothetical protein